MAHNDRLNFYPLTFVQDGESVTIGRPDIESYAQFPEDGAALLRQLQAGLSLAAAASWYRETYDEPIDIEEFLETLRDLGFLREGSATEPGTPAARDNAAFFRQRLGKTAFSAPAWGVYFLLFAAALIAMIQVPHLRPTYQAIFFSPYLTAIELGLFIGQFPGVFLHEMLHVLAGWKQGIPSRLGIGRRLYFIVFETSLTGLWGLPRKGRYLPFLAGMLGDGLWFSVLTLVAALTLRQGSPLGGLGAFCLALAFATLLRFIWQFYFYLQTDLYYVCVNALGCVDLQRTTQRYLRNRLWRLLRRPEKLDDERLWNPRDLQVARWYAVFYMVGCLFTIGTTVFVGFPAGLRVFAHLLEYLINGNAFTPGFWDSFVFMALNLLQLVVLGYVFYRERVQRQRERNARSPAATSQVGQVGQVSQAS